MSKHKVAKLPPLEFVEHPREWRACLQQLQQAPQIAIDLEANSMYAYRERVCLIQISLPHQDFIVDPEKNLDLSGLGNLLADNRVEKIFHAAEYDLILLKRQYGWAVNNLFDTMWAARILGYQRYGLASLLEAFYGVHLNKRFQKSNWCKRPLSNAQLAYAQQDTHFLFALRERLGQELEATGRAVEAAEIFAEQTDVILPDTSFDPDDFWSIHGAQDLTRRQQAILKALAIYRDEEARRRDRPLFKVLNDRTLLELAQRAPTSLSELSEIHGMTQGQIRRYGRSLLQVIKRGKEDPLPTYPRRNKRLPDAVMNRYEKLHTWRKKRARARGVESDVIISRDALWEIAHKNPKNQSDLCRLDTLGTWRCATYGGEIISVIRNA